MLVNISHWLSTHYKPNLCPTEQLHLVFEDITFKNVVVGGGLIPAPGRQTQVALSEFKANLV